MFPPQYMYVKCLCCNRQKVKGDPYFTLSRVPNVIHYLRERRTTFSEKKIQSTHFQSLDSITPDGFKQARICKGCFTYADKNARLNGDKFAPTPDPTEIISPPLNPSTSNQTATVDIASGTSLNPLVATNSAKKPDVPIVRRGNNSHHNCTFGCKTKSKMVFISKRIRRELLMQHRFYAVEDCRMCAEHNDTTDWEPLVKQINRELEPERYPAVMELQRKFYLDLQKEIPTQGLSIPSEGEKGRRKRQKKTDKQPNDQVQNESIEVPDYNAEPNNQQASYESYQAIASINNFPADHQQPQYSFFNPQFTQYTQPSSSFHYS